MQRTTRTEDLGGVCDNIRISLSHVTRCCSASRAGGKRYPWCVAYTLDLAGIATSLDVEKAALHVLGEPDRRGYGIAVLTKGGEADVWFIVERVKCGETI